MPAVLICLIVCRVHALPFIHIQGGVVKVRSRGEEAGEVVDCSLPLASKSRAADNSLSVSSLRIICNITPLLLLKSGFYGAELKKGSTVMLGNSSI